MKNARRQDVEKLTSLRCRADFVAINTNGQRWVTPNIVLQVRSNNGRGQRLGLTVSRRVSKKATVRNRVKRRLRAAARDLVARRGTDDTDYVIIARNRMDNVSYRQLCSDLKWCLKRLECLEG
jgi:ribonuclease P protein component